MRSREPESFLGSEAEVKYEQRHDSHRWTTEARTRAGITSCYATANPVTAALNLSHRVFSVPIEPVPDDQLELTDYFHLLVMEQENLGRVNYRVRVEGPESCVTFAVGCCSAACVPNRMCSSVLESSKLQYLEHSKQYGWESRANGPEGIALDLRLSPDGIRPFLWMVNAPMSEQPPDIVRRLLGNAPWLEPFVVDNWASSVEQQMALPLEVVPAGILAEVPLATGQLASLRGLCLN